MRRGSDRCQLRGQPEFNIFLAARHHRHGDRPDSTQSVNDVIDKNLRCGCAGGNSNRFCALQPRRIVADRLPQHGSPQAIAPHDRDNPRVVLLTPGPYNETYFEQAFLARYLGIALVEGSDLTVRDNLSLGLKLRKVPKEEIARRVAWAGARSLFK